jgi:hypothetical protein
MWDAVATLTYQTHHGRGIGRRSGTGEEGIVRN